PPEPLPGPTNGASRSTSHLTVIGQVRQLLEAATAAGERPWAATLVRLTGATDHQVRQALADLAHDHSDPPPTPPATHTPEHRTATPPHRRRSRHHRPRSTQPVGHQRPPPGEHGHQRW